MQSCCGRVFAEEASFDAHQDKVHPHLCRIELTHAIERDLADLVKVARPLAGDQRAKAARDWAAGQGVSGAPSYITDPETPDPALKFACPYCGRKFASQVALDFHEETSHASQLPEGTRPSGNDGNSAHASQEQADKPDSWNDIQALVREALVEKYRDPMATYCYVWIADIGEDWVVFEFKDEYYRLGYAVDDNSNVTFNGKPVEVVRRTVYQVVQDTEDDDDLDDADSSAATGHKKKKNGAAQESHKKNERPVYVMGTNTSPDPAAPAPDPLTPKPTTTS